MFDDRVYQRGALTLHALRTTVGDQAFFALVQDWAATYRHGTVTTDDFVRLAARHSSGSLDALFRAWLHEPALPPLPRG
jgi:aminopeptidase N